MKVVVAIDSFKGSLTSLQAGRAVSEGIKRVYPEAAVTVRPVADGGEGTVEALTEGLGGVLRQVTVSDPLGRRIQSTYGWIESRRTAILEMSAAAGITLLSKEERNPLHTTTYGVGEMILDALEKGCRHFIVGIGGSATNDGGIGMLQALGFGLWDKAGEPVPPGARGLEKLCRITDTDVPAALRECRFSIACDVTNPLCGENGCSAVYGPQKGADAQTVAEMDGWLRRYAALAGETVPAADENAPGAGAAGGMGFAFSTFLNGTLQPGIALILQETHLEDYVKTADVVITGEGRLDGQTVMGKTPVGVARIAKRHQKPVIAFSGSVTKEAVQCHAAGIDAFFPVLRQVCTLEEAMNSETAYANVADTAEQVFRLAGVASRFSTVG